MSVQVHMKLIDCGRIIKEPSIYDDNWDGAVFDYIEAQKRLKPGQWLWIPDYWSIPDSHRLEFI